MLRQDTSWAPIMPTAMRRRGIPDSSERADDQTYAGTYEAERDHGLTEMN